MRRQSAATSFVAMAVGASCPPVVVPRQSREDARSFGVLLTAPEYTFGTWV
jgi:hypothetical protein